MRPHLFVLLAACRSAPPPAVDGGGGGGEIDGTAHGESITVMSALTGCGLIAGEPTRRVVLFNIADACDAIASSWPDGERWLGIDLLTVAPDGTWSPLATATAPTLIFDDPTGPGVYAALDVDGWSDTGFEAVSGTVSLGSISDATSTGSFDVGLQDGEHISGWFDAPRCTTTSAGPVPNGGLFGCP